MDNKIVSGCSIAYTSNPQPALRITLGKEIKSSLLAAQRSGTPSSLKLQQGTASSDLKATIQIGSKVHVLVGHTLGRSVEHVLRLEYAEPGGQVAAKVLTTPLAVQQRDLTAVRAKVQAASQQAAQRKRQSQTMLLDGPITLTATKERSPSPFGRSQEHSTGKAAPQPQHQQPPPLVANQPGTDGVRAPTRLQNSAAQLGPQQQPRQAAPSHSKPKTPTQAKGTAGVHKRPATATAAASGQQQPVKRQRTGAFQGQQQSAAAEQPGRPGSSAAGAGNGTAQHRQQQQQPQMVEHTGAACIAAAPAFLGRGPSMQLTFNKATTRPSTPAAVAGFNSRQQAPQGKQLPAHPAPAGKQTPAPLQQQQQQQQQGIKRTGADMNSSKAPAGWQNARGIPGANAAAGRSQPHAGSHATDRPRCLQRAMAPAAGNRHSNQAAAIAAGRQDRIAQLRSNLDYQQFDELEEGEILPGLDDGEGEELLHPDPVPQGRPWPGTAAGSGAKQRQQAKPGSGGARGGKGGQTRNKQSQYQQQGKQTAPEMNKAQPQQPGRFKPWLKHKWVAAAALPPNQRYEKKMAKLGKPVEPAHSGVAGPKPVKVAPAKQPQQQQHAADSDVSSKLVVQPPGGSTVSSQWPTRERSATPGSTPTSSHASRGAVDLGPPGYQAFVTRPPRDFQPITSEQQYQQYQQQYEVQLAMYNSLQFAIAANVRSVNSARSKLQAVQEGSQEQHDAAAEAEGLRQQLKPMTENHQKATHALAAEGQLLLAHIKQWLAATGRGSAQHAAVYWPDA